MKTFLLLLLIYEAIGLGFFFYSLAIDNEASSFSWKCLIRNLTYERQSWWMWFKMIQFVPPALAFLIFLWILSKLFKKDPYTT